MQNGVKTELTMTEAEVITYVKRRQDLVGETAVLSCQEIGDGNLNYVFRIKDEANKQSFILKQAGPVARISSEFVVSTDRNRLEYQLLKEYEKIVPDFVPKTYLYDTEKNCLIMEDLSNYTILRTALLSGQFLKHFAMHLATFMAKSHVANLDWVLGGKAKKDKLKGFINPDLCEITEDLVLTEPFYDCPRNDMSQATKALAHELLWTDEVLVNQVKCLKWRFMTDAETLIHGDLHTGSVFVNETQTKVIDHEFACFGPAGFDIGSLVANLMFAKLHHKAVGTEGADTYFNETIHTIIDQYQRIFKEQWIKEGLDDQWLCAHQLEKIMADAAGYAGCELIRRVIGIAKVSDVQSLLEPLKSEVEAQAIKLGKALILNQTFHFI